MTQVLNPSGVPAVLNVDATGALKIAGGGGGGTSTPTALIGGAPGSVNNAMANAATQGITGANLASALVANTWTPLYTETGSGVLFNLLVGINPGAAAPAGTTDFSIRINGVVVATYSGYTSGQLPAGNGLSLVGSVSSAQVHSPGYLPFSGNLVVEVRSTAAEVTNTYTYRSRGFKT